MAEQNITIKVGDTEHPVEKFSDQVKNAVGIYNSINNDLQKHQVETIKCQAALTTLGKQITEAAEAELKLKDESLAKSAEAQAANDVEAALPKVKPKAPRPKKS